MAKARKRRAPKSAKRTTRRSPRGASRVADHGRRIRLDLSRPVRQKLLALEKDRRGRSNGLLFVGAHNVSQCAWCPMQAVLKSRANEAEFFSAYLSDRLRVASKLRMLRRAPKADADWREVLATLEALTLDDAVRADHMQPPRDVDARASRRAARLAARADDPMLAGGLLEDAHAESYPSMRWHFAWRNYIVLGIPDGITDRFVYEFKTASSSRYVGEKFASAQPDIYGTFFGRAQKRVQVLARDTNQIETREGPVDPGRAEEELRLFASVDSGEMPPLPGEYKCRVCEFRESCPLLSPASGT